MKYKGIILSMLLGTILFSGCKNKEVVNPKKEETGVENTEGNISEHEVEKQDELNSKDNNKESEVDTKNVGEGATGSVPIDVQTGESYQIGETIVMKSGEESLYELTIDEIAFTDKRDEYAQDPGNVILVTYTYKNLSDDSSLLIDEMRFQLMKSDEVTLFDSYYLSDVQIPESIEKDSSCTAQIAYGMKEKPETVVLAYQDTVNTEVAPVKITVSNLQ